LSCDAGCANKSRPLYLTADGRVSFDAPGDSVAKFDEYVSDPTKPVPYRPRPIFFGDRVGWQTWLVKDQRFVDGRTDVLTYVSDPLTKPLRLSGAPEVNLYASTSGTDSDWVVKLIDVYPDTVPSQAEMGDMSCQSHWISSAAAIAPAFSIRKQLLLISRYFTASACRQ
jgi:uncharacterized protein